MSPAETLRTAAGLLRGEPAPEPHPVRLPPRMPDVYAEPIAAWLEGAADDLGGVEAYLARTAPGEISDLFDPFDYVNEPNSCEHALAVARAILGRPS